MGPLLTVNITKPDTNKWELKDLEPVSRYRFYLYYCTQTGCGPAASEEYITIPEAREYQSVAIMSITPLHGSWLTQENHGPLIWMAEALVSGHSSMPEDVHFTLTFRHAFHMPIFFMTKQYHSSVGAGTFITVKEDQVLIDLGEG